MAQVVSATFHVRDRAIHCGACEGRIAKALGHLGGVRCVVANHETQTVSVLVDVSVTPLEELRAALARAGFPPAEPGREG